MREPPGDSPTFERTSIAAKLSEVRKTTQVRSHEGPESKRKGKLYTVVATSGWGLVYGHLVKTPRLNEDCGASGCGGDDIPLILIAKRREVHALAGPRR
jgi:hypothetical protein